MTGHRCCVCGFCGNTKAKDPSVTFHRIPKEPEKRALWIKCFVCLSYGFEITAPSISSAQKRD